MLSPLKRLAYSHHSVFRYPSRSVSRFDLKTIRDDQGRTRLSFDALVFSDEHLGQGQFRAREACHMMQYVMAGSFFYLGDEIDFQVPYSRNTLKGMEVQYIAHALRHASNSPSIKIVGNHDELLQGSFKDYDGHPAYSRRAVGKKWGDIRVAHKAELDVRGRRFRILHGHQFDNAVLTKGKGILYNVADVTFAVTLGTDRLLRRLGAEDFYVSHMIRHLALDIFGLTKKLRTFTDHGTEYDGGLIHGHYHRPDILRTEKNRLVIDVGSGTEVMRALAQQGETLALLTWHPDRLVIREENGAIQSVPFEKLGLSHRPLEPIDDIHTRRAERLVSILNRCWPGRPRKYRECSLSN